MNKKGGLLRTENMYKQTLYNLDKLRRQNQNFTRTIGSKGNKPTGNSHGDYTT